MVSKQAGVKTLSASSLPESVHIDVQNRLKRLEGQIRGLQRLLDEGAGCEEIIHQMAAAKAALDRIGYRLVAAGMQHCVSDPDSPLTADDLEKLFLKLS